MPVNAPPQTPFYKSWLKIGGIFLPAYPNSVRFSCPKNYQIPPIIGNYWQWNFQEGLRMPVVEVRLAVRAKANEVLSSTFLNYWLVRSGVIEDDTVAISGGIELFNGRRGIKMLTGVKADSFTIGSTVGQLVTFTARFVGTNFVKMTTLELTAAQTAFPGWNKDCLTSFQHIQFDEPLANSVQNFTLSYSNNHDPNPTHTGTAFVAGQNAGMRTAGMSLVTPAERTPELVLPAGNGECPPPVTPSTIAFTIAHDALTRRFELVNPINNDPDSIEIVAPRNIQQFNLTALGADGTTLPPLVIT